MANTPKQVVGATLGTTGTTYYTVPAGKKLIVKNVLACNIGATTGTVSIAATGRNILYNAPVNVANTLSMDLSLVLEEGHTLVALAGTGTITLMISGIEVG